MKSDTSAASKWVRLDNAANIFLAARNEIDTKVFRLAADLTEDVRPDVLQEALDRVYAQYPLFRAVLRRGVFWYYLQESTHPARVTPDTAAPVTHLYRSDSRELLFRVLYRGRRVSLEVFHALTDGTGALWFFQDLITEYVGLRHPAEFTAAAPSGVKQDFAVDAFTHWFRTGTGQVPFEDEAASAVEPFAEHAAPEPAAAVTAPTPTRHVVRLKGQLTPDLRTRVVELTMPVDAVLKLARTESVSITIYLLALFFAALRDTRAPRRRARTMTASVPINLRQFFPSDSGRNFFAATKLEHAFDVDPTNDTLSAVCQDLDRQFQRTLTRDALARHIQRLVDFERHPLLRVVPRPIKDRVLGLFNRFTNLGTTVAISNLGRVTLPAPAAAHVEAVFFHVSAARPQFCAVSLGSQLTVSFTSPFVETDFQAAFVRRLTQQGVPVRVCVSRVTPLELAEPMEVGG